MAERALIIGASGGIGSALVRTLQGRGAQVVALSRSSDGLDVTNEASVDSCLGALDGTFDVVFVATGALSIAGAEPEKSLRAIRAGAMADQFALNTIGPALCLRHAARLLPRNTSGRWITLSARVGSIGDNRLGGWTSYRAAKAAVNQVVRCAAIELARSHKQAVIAAMHPGTVATPFTEKYLGRHPAVSPDEAATNLLRVSATLSPQQSGAFFDWSGAVVPW